MQYNHKLRKGRDFKDNSSAVLAIIPLFILSIVKQIFLQKIILEFTFHNGVNSLCFLMILYTHNPTIITKVKSSLLSVRFDSDILLTMRAVHST